jgi:hypothetical protein
MILFSKLILAHLLGDFMFQPDRWIKQKEQKKLKAPVLYVHAALHALLVMTIVATVDFVLPALVIGTTHWLIDAVKISFQREQNKRTWFFIDQGLHVLIIVLVWMHSEHVQITGVYSETVIILATVVVFVTTPCSVIIKTVISRWAPAHAVEAEGTSLMEAGKYIGILERLFVLTFVLTAHWEAVGFLLAAKSVFRFGDLKDAHDRKLTEYVLIGTLLSFGLAMAAGLVAASMLR